jgi:hypothetical protein
LTAEYLPGVLNQQADWESRHFLDSSNWKLNPGVFKILNQQWGPLEVDLFASRTKGQNYKRITDNPLFCVISTINCYHDRNKGWHNGSGKSQLLLSFVEPHKPVVPCTIAGWLVQVMSSAGVDTPKFRAHSTRGTATSKGQAKGLSRQEIINMARWKKASTLKRHYLRDIVTDTEKSCTHWNYNLNKQTQIRYNSVPPNRVFFAYARHEQYLISVCSWNYNFNAWADEISNFCWKRKMLFLWAPCEKGSLLNSPNLFVSFRFWVELLLFVDKNV